MPFQHPLPSLCPDGEDHYILVGELVYVGKRQTFVVPSGYRTDLASVPRALRWLIPSAGLHSLAAILHDVLCDAINKGKAILSSRDTDRMFALRICRELGVSPMRQWLLWTGVTWGALASRRGRRVGRGSDIPRLVLLSILFAPLVAPATVLVAVGLLIESLVNLVWRNR